MKIAIESPTALKMIYMRRIGAYGAENYTLMQKMKDYLHEKRLWSDDGVIYAITWDDPSATLPEKCRFDVCFLSDRASDDVVQSGMLPSGQYAVFTLEHTQKAVSGFWQIFMTELYGNGYTFNSERPIMERYRAKTVAEGLCEFCVPIK